MINDALLNNCALRSFRDTADLDYIAARLSFRAQLVPQFLWQSLQAIEKYLKCTMVLNRIKVPKTHSIDKLLLAFEAKKKFDIRISADARKFLTYVDTFGRFRYFETPYYTGSSEQVGTDLAQPLLWTQLSKDGSASAEVVVRQLSSFASSGDPGRGSQVRVPAE